jgi:hypothetical protein
MHTCGIDLGWRLIEDDGSLRVAYLVGSDGHTEILHLPAALLARWHKARDLQSLRSKYFDSMRTRLSAWLAEHEAPAWLAEACQYLDQWRSPGRLAMLLRTWQPFPDGDELRRQLQAWQERDVHLWQYERALQLKAKRLRRDLYRKFAARTRRRYTGIAIEDCDWRKLAARVKAERDDQPANQTARWQMRLASVGMLRDCLVSQGAIPSKTEDTTRICHACGTLNDWDREIELEHICDECGALWDQDENAARNLLALAEPSEKPQPRTMVYSYGAKPPLEGNQEIDRQIGAAHRYYNQLVALHRDFAQARKDAKRRHIPGLEEAEQAVEVKAEQLSELRKAIRSRNAIARRKTASRSDRQAAAAMREELNAARDERRRLREQASTNAAYQQELSQLIDDYQGLLVDPSDPDNTRRRGGKFKDARAQSNVFWGTYLEVEKALEQARNTTKTGRIAFRRWTGDGLVAVQIQGGMSPLELWQGRDTRARLEPRPPKQALLWLRISSDGRDPVWAKVPFFYHRPLPEEATVMGIALVRRQVATRRKADGEWHPYYDWTVNFTLRFPSGKVLDEMPGSAREPQENEDIEDTPKRKHGGGRWGKRKTGRSQKVPEKQNV